MKLSTSVLLLAGVSLFSLSSQAEENLRLIEIQPGGPQRWVTSLELDQISHSAHAKGRCGGFMDVTDFAKPQALGFVEALVDFDKIQPRNESIVQPMLQNVDAGDLMAIITHLSNNFHNRHYDRSPTGIAAAEWIKAQYEKIGASRNDVKVELVNHRNFDQPSVIATIQGSGPNKNEIVIIGGHIDSINQDAFFFSKHKARAPGADDNASGTATVMQTFKLLVDSGFRPNRTIQFMGYAGEEAGLLGSQDIAKKYRDQKKAVVAVMQFDMTMLPEPNPTIQLINDHTSEPLNRLTGRLLDHYVKAKWALSACGYACSDHASWTRSGYSATFPTEASIRFVETENKTIHTEKDRVEILNPGFGTHFLKLAIAFAVEVAQPAL
jgi:leucyl aminopeptidase